MLLQLHLWHQNPHGALATDAAARALSSALPIWEEEIFKGKKKGKKEKGTAFFISLTAHYHGNSPGLAWLAGPPLPITGGNNTIRRERGGEMRVQYCIQSIILQLNVFSCRLGRSVLGGRNNSPDVWRNREIWVCSITQALSWFCALHYCWGLGWGGDCRVGSMNFVFFFKCSIVQLLWWRKSV